MGFIWACEISSFIEKQTISHQTILNICLRPCKTLDWLCTFNINNNFNNFKNAFFFMKWNRKLSLKRKQNPPKSEILSLLWSHKYLKQYLWIQEMYTVLIIYIKLSVISTCLWLHAPPLPAATINQQLKLTCIWLNHLLPPGHNGEIFYLQR